MAENQQTETCIPAAKGERQPEEGFGLDRIVTAVAFLATVALILLSPFG